MANEPLQEQLSLLYQLQERDQNCCQSSRNSKRFQITLNN